MLPLTVLLVSVAFLAAELQIEYLNGFDTEHSPGNELEFQAVTFTGNLKAYLPLGRFQPFFLAGVGLGYFEFDTVWVEISDTAFAARFGGGFDFYLTDALALQLSSSYVLQTGDLDGVWCQKSHELKLKHSRGLDTSCRSPFQSGSTA